MSYDLLFTASSGKKIDKKAFAAHFGGRRNYEVNKKQAVYQNEDTGVYFIFDAPDSDGVVAFNLNYFRPHVFGLEAAPELEIFATSLRVTTGDPQGEIEDGTQFTREAFLRGWNAGNKFACRAMLKEQSGPVHTWPSKKIEDIWDWNYARPTEAEERTRDDKFVPGIFAVEIGGVASSVAIWPPQCPIILPAVDAVLVPCEQREDNEGTALVMWDEISPLLAAYEEKGSGLTHYRIAFEQWSAELTSFLGQKRQEVGEMKGVGLDEILDQELIEEASEGR
jgi:hypothetical protein